MSPVHGKGLVLRLNATIEVNLQGIGSQGSPSFVQMESSGQLSGPQPNVQMTFDAAVAQNDIIIAILGWETTGPDPDGPLFDNVGNEYEEFAAQTSGPHRSRVYICWAAKPGLPTLEADWSGSNGFYPSITAVEYAPGQLGGSLIMATGDSTTWNGTPTVTGVPAIIIAIVDTTQNGFTVPDYMNLRTYDGFSAPMRQAIADRSVTVNGTYDAPISFANAPFEGTTLVLFGSSFGVTGTGKITVVSGSGAVT